MEIDNACMCGSSLGGIVTCSDDPENIELNSCYCMTTDEDKNKTVVGSCPYTCVVPVKWYPNQTLLDYHMCNETWKRTGQLCSQCLDNHGPLVYSYSIQCIPCSSKVVTDSIIFVLALVMLLIGFCLIIITLRISGARPPMNTFILVSQVMSAPQYLFLAFVPKHHKTPYVSKTVHDDCWKLFATFFGLWNLDICRSCFPSICLSANMTTLQAQFLEYIIALFPLTILLVVFFSVKLYDRGCRIIFCVCRPVHSCFAHLRRTIDVRTSLIDAFATSIILSLSKIGYTSFRILQPVYVYSPDGRYSVFAFNDPSIKYFGRGHLPYALPALAFVVVFILIPLLLLFLYPLRSFQTFLNNRQWQCSALHIFADTFQGCYKNGTNRTRDYRWFAGLHLLMRFVIVVFYDVSKYQKLTIVFMIIFITLYMTTLAAFQPYKKHVHLKLDMVLFIGLVLWSVAVLAGTLGYDGDSHFDFILHQNILLLGCVIPTVYLAGLILYWLLILKKLHMWIIVRWKQMFHSEDQRRLLDHSA